MLLIIKANRKNNNATSSIKWSLDTTQKNGASKSQIYKLIKFNLCIVEIAETKFQKRQ